jgi:hypothetical protein
MQRGIELREVEGEAFFVSGGDKIWRRLDHSDPGQNIN